ncbi:hypothetical protein [Streptomyces dangxiongensis]|uniref:hypothetical protein n=1 Tax=Streptomyces dangxiongensis TaxID=1442032 RepID=UPI001F09C484|nr:hypothetical protein [Streptomyces dangxiongensis]
MPKALCGVSVPSDALSDLLPDSGERVTVRRTGSLDDGSTVCEVEVDADTVLVISGERIDAGSSAHDILSSRLSVREQKAADGGSVAYTDQSAVSLVRCRGAAVREEDISTLVKVLKPARRDEAAMKKFIRRYTASLKEQRPCKAAS